jgi:hypothetical protein
MGSHGGITDTAQVMFWSPFHIINNYFFVNIKSELTERSLCSKILSGFWYPSVLWVIYFHRYLYIFQSSNMLLILHIMYIVQ